jgi:hypothetical protein
LRANRIVAAIGGENGAVAASQVTGKRGLISEDANASLGALHVYLDCRHKDVRISPATSWLALSYFSPQNIPIEALICDTVNLPQRQNVSRAHFHFAYAFAIRPRATPVRA